MNALQAVKSRSKRSNSHCAVKSSTADIHSTAAPSGARLSAFYAAGPVFGLGGQVKTSMSSDPYEREADLVAEKVTAGHQAPPISGISPGYLIQRQEEEEEEEKEEETVQTLPILGQEEEEEKVEEEEIVQILPVQSQVVEEEKEVEPVQTDQCSACNISKPTSSAINTVGPGEPLRPSTQSILEARIGVDLSDVRVHNDSTSWKASRALKARAFTHGSDVWLGQGESQHDLRLMAHEATHVIQQTATPGLMHTIQSKPSDYQHPEDGGGVQNRLQQHFDEELEGHEGETVEGAGAESGAEQSTRTIDPRELNERSGELEGDTKPDVDRPAQEEPQIEQSAQAVEQEIESPSEPLVEVEEQPEPEEEGGEEKEATSAADQAASLVAEAFAAAEAEPEPMQEMNVIPPEPVAPIDSAGELLDADPATEGEIVNLADQAQQLREQGHMLQVQAAQERRNAHTLSGNIELVSGEISKAEEGIASSRVHTTYRREVLGQAGKALVVSEEKAATVAEQAPQYTSKADEGKEETAPMSSEANELAAENSANTPENSRAGGKSREQGQKINRVGSDAATMDEAVTQTKDKAESLAQDAAHAAELNTQTQENITETQETLDQTDERLNQMDEETAQARSQIGNVARAPVIVRSQADQLDQQARGLIAASFEIENRLNAAQRSYENGMKGVPRLEPWEEEAGEETAIQTLPEEGNEVEAAESEMPVAAADVFSGTGEGRYEEREQINLSEELPPWLTGIDPVSEEQRENARQREEERRQREVEQINEFASGRFEDLDAADKVAIALSLTGQNFYNSISNIHWPGWGGLAKMLLDPRSMLTGVVSGLSTMLSGAAGLFSAEQWIRDPLGNLLKSSADIATGLTLVLGTITALAAVVAAIMGALILITFGAASPIAVPVISVCTTIITTVGGWTIAVGKIALVLQFLSLIKNLIDAATAETAEDLQNQADQIRTDTVAAGTAVLAIAGAKGAQAGIKSLRRRAIERFAVTRGRGLGARVRALGRLEGRRIARGARRIGRGVTRGAAAVRRGFVGGARAIAGRVRRTIPSTRRRISRLWERLRSPAARRRGGAISIVTSERVRGRISINKGTWGKPIEVVENLRSRLLQQKDIGRVQRSLIERGIPVDRDLIKAVKRYNFDNPAIEFHPDNYNAWRNLATGRFTIDDVRYFVHEMVEVGELRRIQSRTGFDFLGTAWENMTKRQRARWISDFNRIYNRAHARALEAEYDFVARQIAEVTNGRVRISRTIAAAVDPLRDEGRLYMLVDGIPLQEHFNFTRWEARAQETVSIGRSAAVRLRLTENPTLSEIVAAIKWYF